MFARTGTGASRRQAGIGVVLSASAFLLAAGAAVLAETPALAQANVSDAAFESAFASFDLTDAETQLGADAVLAAEARFAQAPVDEADEGSLIGIGNASYYGNQFRGRSTASGERFDPSALTAAHRTLPFGTKIKVTNTRNGRSVIVRVNDRGPFHGNRMIDLSHEAARQIGIVSQGHGQVRLASLNS